MSPPRKSSDPPDDASIPVLTERLALPPLELDTTLPQEPMASSTSAPTMPLVLDITLPLGLPQSPPPPPPAPRAASAPARPMPTPRPATLAPAPGPASLTPAPKPATLSPAPKPAAVPAAQAPAPATSTSPSTNTSTHWTRVELELRSSILQAIADSLPQQIDSIVRRRMNDAIERLFTQLVAETRLAVAASLRDIVDQAVRAELARLRGQKR
jgi:hypothetical protein